MNFELLPLPESLLPAFYKDVQEAFQKGYEAVFGPIEQTILPTKDIDRSFRAEGSAAYGAFVDGELMGGAVVVIHPETQHNHLDLLYVKHGTQSTGIGKAIWDSIEKRYPETRVWETCTPYFDQRNIHFYLNKCGFHITEYWNRFHPAPDEPEDFIGDGKQGMFEFKKWMTTETPG